MDRSNLLLKPKEEYSFQVKTEIKTEIQTDDNFTEHDDSPQYYQQGIIKEELMLSSDDLMENSADDDESESKSDDCVKRRINDDLVIENPCENQKTPLAGLIKLPVLKKDDIDLDQVIAKFGKANCTKCRKQFKAVPRQIRCKLCSRAYLYKCSTCLDSSYKTFNDLCHHLKIKHTTLRELYTCSTCKKSYNQRKRLNEHLNVCGLTAGFKCKLCPYKARYKCNLVNHVKNKHAKPAKLSCDRCGKKYTHERSVKRHMKLYCGKKKSFKCEHCDFAAYRRHQLIGHFKLKHPKLYPKSA